MLPICQKSNQKYSYNQHNAGKHAGMYQAVRGAGSEYIGFKLLNRHSCTSSISSSGSHPSQLSSAKVGSKRTAGRLLRGQQAVETLQTTKPSPPCSLILFFVRRDAEELGLMKIIAPFSIFM